MSTQPDPKKKSATHRLGTFLLVAGGSIIGTTLGRLIMGSARGNIYWEFIVGGLVVAAIGLALVRTGGRKGQDL